MNSTRRAAARALALVALSACATPPPPAGYRFPETGPLQIDLAGEWRFRLDPSGTGESAGWGAADADDSDWTRIAAPGLWEHQGFFGVPEESDIANPWEYNGTGWYRRRVRVPRQWAGRDLVLNLGRIDDAGKVFWNGTLIGESHSADQDNRWTVPASEVAAGEDNTLAVAVTDFGGPGGLDSGPLTLRPVWPWSGLKLDLMDMPGDYLFPAGEHVDFNIRVENPLPQGFFGVFHIVVTPFEREPIRDAVHGPIWINPHPDYTKALGVLLGVLPPGHFTVDITLSAQGQVVAQRRRAFAVVQSVEHLDPEGSPFGLNSAALFHLDLPEHATEGERRLRQAEASGAPWGRNDLWWGQIEVAPDEWDWRECDSAVRRYAAHGINLLAILCYDSAWSGDVSPCTPAMRSEWLDYVRHVVGRYHDRVHAWEVWNEPNLAEFWHPAPDLPAYTELLRQTHAAIKEIDPEATVLGAVTSGVPLDFIRPILDAGGGEWMDALSVHPYQVQQPTNWSERIPHGQLRLLRAELDARGLGDLPIWITEEGWPTPAGKDYDLQARQVAQFYASMLASGLVEKVFWFNLTDWGEPDLPSGGHLGLVEIDGTPKPSYAAFNNVIARLHDFDRVADLSRPEVRLWRFVFHRPAGRDHAEENVTVLWAEGERQAVEWPAQARAVDLVGSPIERVGTGVGAERATLLVGPSPVYLVEELAP